MDCGAMAVMLLYNWVFCSYGTRDVRLSLPCAAVLVQTNYVTEHTAGTVGSVPGISGAMRSWVGTSVCRVCLGFCDLLDGILCEVISRQQGKCSIFRH